MATSSGTSKAVSYKPEALLRSAGITNKATVAERGTVLFHQGDRADALFFLLHGRVQLTVTVLGGREATVSILGPGDVFGERCLTVAANRAHTATILSTAEMIRVDTAAALRAICKDIEFGKYVLDRLVSRTNAYEAKLVHHITNNSERRLARILLELAHYDGRVRSLKPVDGISQSVLAEMVGTTRPRINSFMNKFRRDGLIEYEATNIVVKPGLVKVLLSEDDVFPASGQRRDF